MATMTACASMEPPSANRTVRAHPLISSAVAVRAVMSSAPNFSACLRARWASWLPDTPSGKAEVVLDPRTLAGLAAGRGAFDEHRAQSLGGAVDGGGQAGGPAADDDQVVELLRRCGGQAQRVGQLGVGGFDEGVAAFGDDDR